MDSTVLLDATKKLLEQSDEISRLRTSLKIAYQALAYYSNYIGNDEHGVQARKAMRVIEESGCFELG